MRRARGHIISISSLILTIAPLIGVSLLGVPSPAGAATSPAKACITNTVTWTYDLNNPNADVPYSGPFVGRHNAGDGTLDVSVDINQQIANFKTHPPYYLTTGEMWFANGQKFNFSYSFAETSGPELSPGDTTITKVVMHASTCAPGPPPPPPITVPLKTIASKAVLRVNRTTLKVGQVLVLTATVTPIIDFRVVDIQEHAAGGWVQVAQFKLNPRGTATPYRLKLSALGRVRLRLLVPPDEPWNGTTSNVVVEVVK